MVTIGHSHRAYGSAVLKDPTRIREETLEVAGADGKDSSRREQCLRTMPEKHYISAQLNA
jgi:hypothetical protein